MNYDTALKLKVLGLNQDRRTGSQYYITPDIVMNIEDVGSIKSPIGITVDITPFVFIPHTEHLIHFLGHHFGEVRMMIDAKDYDMRVCAYAREQAVRAFGPDMVTALANLAIIIYEEERITVQG